MINDNKNQAENQKKKRSQRYNINRLSPRRQLGLNLNKTYQKIWKPLWLHM